MSDETKFDPSNYWNGKEGDKQEIESLVITLDEGLDQISRHIKMLREMIGPKESELPTVEQVQTIYTDKPMDLPPFIDRLTEERALACETLTKGQFVEALRQAILAGDFERQVVAGAGAQAIVYLPYRRCGDLEARIKRLERRLSDCGVNIAIEFPENDCE